MVRAIKPLRKLNALRGENHAFDCYGRKIVGKLALSNVAWLPHATTSSSSLMPTRNVNVTRCRVC
jgi:hypothetical protein